MVLLWRGRLLVAAVAAAAVGCAVVRAAPEATDPPADDFVKGSEFSVPELKDFIALRGLSVPGLHMDLVTLAAQISRVEGWLVSSAPLTPSSMRSILEQHEVSTEGDSDTLFDRLFPLLALSNHIRTHAPSSAPFPASLHFPVESAEAKAVLRALGFAERVLSTMTYEELLKASGSALDTAATIKDFLATPSLAMPASWVSEELRSRGLDTAGTALQRLTRLATALQRRPRDTREECVMVVEHAVCVGGGRKVLPPAAALPALVARYSFDDNAMSDDSGNGNHPTAIVPSAVGRGGHGASAAFDGISMFEVAHSPSMPSSDLSVAFWVFLTGDSTGTWRTLFHKGATDHERTPTLMLEPQARGIELFVSTDSEDHPSGERVWSGSYLPLGRWTHVVGVVEGHSLRLFIDGVLDAEATTVGNVVHNTGPWYVGNDPWRIGGGAACLIDDFRIFSRALNTTEIQAEAALAVAVEPDFASLGCVNCTVDVCMASCDAPHVRVCSRWDLDSGAYVAARGRGWVRGDTRLWVAEDTEGAVVTPLNGVGAFATCVCCRAGTTGDRRVV